VSEALEAVTANATRAWHDDTGMHVRLRIVNHSDRTLFVGRGKRRLQFDADASLLTVWLCDHELEESIGQRCAIGLTMPSAVALGAGTEVELSIDLPTKIFQMQLDGDQVKFIERTTSEYRNISLRSAVAETPFYYSPRGEPLAQQLCRWGAPLKVELAVPAKGEPQLGHSEGPCQ